MSPLPATVTDNSVFEGLFHRALTLTPELSEKLRAVGYEPQRPEGSYPTKVWRDCLEATRLHLFPRLSRAEGLGLLGRKTIDGFLDTFSGKVIGALLPFIGPEGLVKRWPRFYSAGRQGVAITIKMLPERTAEIHSVDGESLPEFVIGLVEGTAQRTGKPLKVTLLERSATGYVLQARW